MNEKEPKLLYIASARSGDKGANANIGVIAHTKEGFAFIKNALTAEVVRDYFAKLSPSRVERFELAKIRAFNFLLYGALGGGGSRSLRIDAQGKALGQALLQMRLPLSEEDLKKMR